METDAEDDDDDVDDDNDGTDESDSVEPLRCLSVSQDPFLQLPLLLFPFHFSARTPFILLRRAWTRFIRPLCFLIQW